MPTQESAQFLAKKPKVAPTFEGVDYEDNVALKAAQDSIIREQWVQSMMARLVREEMGKCYRREGVNHLEKCGHLRGMATHMTSRLQTPLSAAPGRMELRWHGSGGSSFFEQTMADRSFVERYFELLKSAKVKGYLFAQTNTIEKS